MNSTIKLIWLLLKIVQFLFFSKKFGRGALIFLRLSYLDCEEKEEMNHDSFAFEANNNARSPNLTSCSQRDNFKFVLINLDGLFAWSRVDSYCISGSFHVIYFFSCKLWFILFWLVFLVKNKYATSKRKGDVLWFALFSWTGKFPAKKVKFRICCNFPFFWKMN